MYRRSFLALQSLQPDRAGYELLKPLPNSDVRGPSREADEVYLTRGGQLDNLPSIGTYVEPWFWFTYGATAKAGVESGFTTPSDTSDVAEHEKSLYDEQRRMIWAKTHARSDCWSEEEVTLVCEEMCRILAFLNGKAAWWIGKIQQATNENSQRTRNTDHVTISGKAAYAHEQAAIYRTIASEFAIKWAPLVIHHNLGEEWLHEYLPPNFICPPLKRAKRTQAPPFQSQPTSET
jgi:hypothetical protein